MKAATAIIRDPTTTPETRWDDDRGRLSFRNLIDGDETPSEALTFGTATLVQGDFLAPHRHSHAEIYYILEGAAELTVAGQIHAVAAGCGIFIPGNAEHAICNTNNVPCRFLYAFAADRFSEITYVFSPKVTP